MSLRSIHLPKSIVQKTCHVDHILKSVTVKCRPTNILLVALYRIFWWAQIIYTKNVQVCIFTIHSFSLFYNILIVWSFPFLQYIHCLIFFTKNTFICIFILIFCLLLQDIHLQLLIRHTLFYSFYPRYSLKVSIVMIINKINNCPITNSWWKCRYCF